MVETKNARSSNSHTELELTPMGYFIAYTLFHWLLQVVTDYSLELTRYIKEKVSIQTDLH